MVERWKHWTPIWFKRWLKPWHLHGFWHLEKKIEGLLRRTICCHKLHGGGAFCKGSLKNCDVGFMYVSKWQTWPLFSKVFREVSCPRFTLLWALYLRISLDVAGFHPKHTYRWIGYLWLIGNPPQRKQPYTPQFSLLLGGGQIHHWNK